MRHIYCIRAPKFAGVWRSNKLLYPASNRSYEQNSLTFVFTLVLNAQVRFVLVGRCDKFKYAKNVLFNDDRLTLSNLLWRTTVVDALHIWRTWEVIYIIIFHATQPDYSNSITWNYCNLVELHESVRENSFLTRSFFDIFVRESEVWIFKWKSVEATCGLLTAISGVSQRSSAVDLQSTLEFNSSHKLVN